MLVNRPSLARQNYPSWQPNLWVDSGIQIYFCVADRNPIAHKMRSYTERFSDTTDAHTERRCHYHPSWYFDSYANPCIPPANSGLAIIFDGTLLAGEFMVIDFSAVSQSHDRKYGIITRLIPLLVRHVRNECSGRLKTTYL